MKYKVEVTITAQVTYDLSQSCPIQERKAMLIQMSINLWCVDALAAAADKEVPRNGGGMKSPTGKWFVTMKRDGKLNKALVNADSEWNAMFVAETINGHKGWVSSSAVPAVLITPEGDSKDFATCPKAVQFRKGKP